MITYEEYCSVIAQGCLTNSKHPRSFVNGIYPKFYDDNCIDFICGLGTDLTGNKNNPSLASSEEYHVAKRLNELFPFSEKWKFLKTGSEAASASIRIARAHNGRTKILSEAYHGWHDGFVSLTPPATGVKDIFYFESFKSFDQLTEEVSAVIIEAVVTDWSNARKKWLQALRKRTKELGIILIFDEIITGFRFNKYSVANHFGIYPDLLLLGKALGGGMPLSAVGGSALLMDGNYFVSSTFAGDRYSLLRSIGFLKDFHPKDLWEDGKDFLKEFNSYFPERVRIEGYPTRGRFEGDDFKIALFFQEMIKQNILFGRSWFYSYPLMEKKKEVLLASKNALRRIKDGLVVLEGDLPTSPFADKVRAK